MAFLFTVLQRIIRYRAGMVRLSGHIKKTTRKWFKAVQSGSETAGEIAGENAIKTGMTDSLKKAQTNRLTKAVTNCYGDN